MPPKPFAQASDDGPESPLLPIATIVGVNNDGTFNAEFQTERFNVLTDEERKKAVKGRPPEVDIQNCTEHSAGSHPSILPIRARDAAASVDREWQRTHSANGRGR